jgi:hypothetical protein
MSSHRFATGRRGAAALALVALIAPRALAQAGNSAAAQDPPPKKEQDQEQPKPVEKAQAWPEVDAAAIKSEVERLRKARTEEMGADAQAVLIAAGAGVAPFLIDKLPHEKDESALARMKSVLEVVTDARHTRLLMQRFGDRAPEVRIWSLTRVALFPDPGVRAEAEKACAAALKRKAKADPQELFAAALCCASSGSFVGFERICSAAEESWGADGEAIGTALGALRGPQATERVAPLLKEESRKRQQAGLRLLAACGDKQTAVGLVAPFLDNTDNTLRVAAINALRGIVDGDPPLPKLPVFEAIERANKWKARL